MSRVTKQNRNTPQHTKIVVKESSILPSPTSPHWNKRTSQGGNKNLGGRFINTIYYWIQDILQIKCWLFKGFFIDYLIRLFFVQTVSQISLFLMTLTVVRFGSPPIPGSKWVRSASSKPNGLRIREGWLLEEIWAKRQTDHEKNISLERTWSTVSHALEK